MANQAATRTMSYDPGRTPDTAEELERLINRGYNEQHAVLWRQAGLRPGMSVLDVGCGPGDFSVALAGIVEHGRVLAVDINERMLSEAELRIASSGLKNIELSKVSDDCSELRQEFDFAWARYVLQHAANPTQLCRSLHRVLRPGGIACFVDADREFIVPYPEIDGWSEIYREIIDGQRARGGDPLIGRKLGTLLAEAGFQDIELQMSCDVLRGAQIDWFARNVFHSLIELYLPPARRPRAITLLRAMQARCSENDMFIYHVVFVATAKRSAS